MDLEQFETRKQDHLRLSLDARHEAKGLSGFAAIHLAHEALPDLNFSEVQTGEAFWDYRAASPFFLSSMTAGHHAGEAMNLRLARVASQKRWPMGLGSQRRELKD